MVTVPRRANHPPSLPLRVRRDPTVVLVYESSAEASSKS